MLIENKIIRESSKFIPYLNPGEISKGPDGKYSQTIELKVSLGGVRNAILAMGLGSDSEEPIVILPMIAWNDTVKTATYRWWTSESVKNPTNFIVPFYDRMHRVLAKEFNLQGFPFVFPMGVSGGLLIPDSLRFERPKASDLPDLAEFFNSTVMLKGEVFVRQSSKFSSGIQAQVRLSAIHMERNRLIAESIRKIELENGNDGFLKQKFSDEVGEMARDLSSQISDAWQKGTIGAMLVKLVFKGPHNPKISGEIKNLVLRSSAQVRAIKERLFEPRQLTFEMDFTGSVPELVESLQSQTLQSKPLKIISSDTNSIVIGL